MPTMMLPDRLYAELLEDRVVADLLGTLRDHHEETFDHSLAVARLSLELGYGLGIGDAQLVKLGYGAFLHDTGKLFIPPEILAKRDALNEEETLLIREHPRKGFDLISTADETIRSLVVAHHEYKRDPYPRDADQVFEGQERRTPQRTELIQILSLADMYVALSENRPYHDRLNPAMALSVLEREFRGDRRYLDSLVHNARVTSADVTPPSRPTPA